MKIEKFVFNPLYENTYVIWDQTNECAIIDAGCLGNNEFDRLEAFIRQKNLKPVKLINTHCHFDHIFGVDLCRKKYSLQWEAHPDDFFLVDNAPAQTVMFGLNIDPIACPDKEIYHESIIRFGQTQLQAIHVPGHSPGSLCFYNQKTETLFSGDVLFSGSIGRTDLQKGDYNLLIDGIRTKILTLPDSVKVYPGHGPKTSIGIEKTINQFLQ